MKTTTTMEAKTTKTPKKAAAKKATPKTPKKAAAKKATPKTPSPRKLENQKKREESLRIRDMWSNAVMGNGGVWVDVPAHVEKSPTLGDVEHPAYKFASHTKESLAAFREAGYEGAFYLRRWVEKGIVFAEKASKDLK